MTTLSSLLFLVAGCSKSGTDASFDQAYFLLESNEDRRGSGVLLLSDTEVQCGELTTTSDWQATLFGMNALYISLSYNYAENPTGDPWVRIFSANAHDADGSTFTARSYLYTDDGLILQDDSGLLVEIEQYSFDGVSGSYEQVWSSGSFDAEHCGMINTDGNDSSW